MFYHNEDVKSENAGIYIHIPFCQHKCGYCDFYSLEDNNHLIENYILFLQREIDLYASENKFSTLEYDTIYLGGGTPSLLSPDQIGSILKSLLRRFNISITSEITLEANPETISVNKLTEYRNIGINRISLGIQSFFDDELTKLDRIHLSEDVYNAYHWIRKTGLENVNIDLMFSIPGQTYKRWQDSIENAINLSPEHISTYSLTIEPHTPFSRLVASGKLKTFSEGEDVRRYRYAMERFESAGYEHYEISNFAKTGYRSRHNSKYWHGIPYLGLGVSAHSFIENRRFWNPRSMEKYFRRLSENKFPVEGEEILGRNEQMFEYLFLNLRTMEGLNINSFESEFQFNFEKTFKAELRKFVDRKKPLMYCENGNLKLTRSGRPLCDEICGYFQPKLVD